MIIKVEIEVDGTLLSRLEDERPGISADSVGVVSNMARMEAREQAEEHVRVLTEKRAEEETKAARRAASKTKKEAKGK